MTIGQYEKEMDKACEFYKCMSNNAIWRLFAITCAFLAILNTISFAVGQQVLVQKVLRFDTNDEIRNYCDKLACLRKDDPSNRKTSG